MNSLMPCAEYIFMMCHNIGFPPISTIGFGRALVSSDNLVPNPPARRMAFIVLIPCLVARQLRYCRLLSADAIPSTRKRTSEWGVCSMGFRGLTDDRQYANMLTGWATHGARPKTDHGRILQPRTCQKRRQAGRPVWLVAHCESSAAPPFFTPAGTFLGLLRLDSAKVARIPMHKWKNSHTLFQ